VATNKVTHHIAHWKDAVAEMIRVLKPGDYLIYNDIVYPVWAARIGQTLAGKWFGFPTIKGLETIAGQNELSQIHLSRATTIYETIYQLPS
jgi:ubiquinone/menaquinone biosynthesis C-methylase UbiE